MPESMAEIRTAMVRVEPLTPEQIRLTARMGELRLAVDRKLAHFDATNPPPRLPDPRSPLDAVRNVHESHWWASTRASIGCRCPEAIELRRLQMAYVRSLKGGA